MKETNDNNLIPNNSGDMRIENLSLETELKSIMLNQGFNAFKLCCKTIVAFYTSVFEYQNCTSCPQ